jgi:hypothetical protein
VTADQTTRPAESVQLTVARETLAELPAADDNDRPYYWIGRLRTALAELVAVAGGMGSGQREILGQALADAIGYRTPDGCCASAGHGLFRGRRYLWSRLYANLPDLPPVQAAEDAELGAFGLLVQSMCYCTRAESEGFIPLTQVPRFGGVRLRQRVAALLREKLWILAEGGYVINPDIYPESLCNDCAADLDLTDAYLQLAVELGIEVTR